MRVREKLRDSGAVVSYSTLTWFCREHGIGLKEKVPVRRILTGPGEEMQHDTSPYVIAIGGKEVKRQCASLVLGYSRMIFIRFYPRFDRFYCKVFLTDAFKYFGGTCRRCVIDNTSIAIACGAGRLAQVAPEMESFELRFGFKFMAHAIDHADRKGKVERPFWYVERNFLVGRTFKDDDDLNRQAALWVEQTANPRQLRELKASPRELFAAERGKLTSLPLYVPEVYRLCQRTVDVYGCISLHAMKYPAPVSHIGKSVIVREYQDRVILLDGIKEIATHARKVEGSPAATEKPAAPATPVRRKQAHDAEENKLKALGSDLQAYLALLKVERGPRYIWSVRKLYQLLGQYRVEDLTRAVAKANRHRLTDVRRVETILLQDIAQRDYYLPLSLAPQEYENLPQYQQGAHTPQPDLDSYVPPEDPDDPGNS